jgi:hypothetical protein
VQQRRHEEPAISPADENINVETNLSFHLQHDTRLSFPEKRHQPKLQLQGKQRQAAISSSAPSFECLLLQVTRTKESSERHETKLDWYVMLCCTANN